MTHRDRLHVILRRTTEHGEYTTTINVYDRIDESP